MKNKISKTDVQNQIDDFFKNIREKSSSDIKKIKKIAMSKKIPLKEKRKLFCKYCLNPYKGLEKIRIKNKIKSIECHKCGKVSRWKIL